MLLMPILLRHLLLDLSPLLSLEASPWLPCQ